MRTSLFMLAAAMLGVVGGAALIGLWAVGVAIIADSVFLAVVALRRDDGTAERPLAGVATLQQVLEKARAAP